MAKHRSESPHMRISHSFFITVSAIVFATLAVVHGMAASLGWPVVINEWQMPTWVSWMITLVGFLLAIHAIKSMR